MRLVSKVFWIFLCSATASVTAFSSTIAPPDICPYVKGGLKEVYDGAKYAFIGRLVSYRDHVRGEVFHGVYEIIKVYKGPLKVNSRVIGPTPPEEPDKYEAHASYEYSQLGDLRLLIGSSLEKKGGEVFVQPPRCYGSSKIHDGELPALENIILKGLQK